MEKLEKQFEKVYL